MARVMVAVAVGAGKSELQLDMHSNILSITPAATCRSPLEASTSNKECSAERSMLFDVLALPGRLHRSPRPVDARLHGQGAELPSRLVISPHATHMAHAKQTHNLARRHNYVPARARTRRKLSMPHAHRCQDLGSCGFDLYISARWVSMMPQISAESQSPHGLAAEGPGCRWIATPGKVALAEL